MEVEFTVTAGGGWSRSSPRPFRARPTPPVQKPLTLSVTFSLPLSPNSLGPVPSYTLGTP